MASPISMKPSVPARTLNGDCEGRKPYGVMPGEQETIAERLFEDSPGRGTRPTGHGDSGNLL